MERKTVKKSKNISEERVFEVYKAMYLWQSHKKSVHEINLQSILDAAKTMVMYFEEEISGKEN